MSDKLNQETPDVAKKSSVVIPQRQRTPIEMQTGPRLSGISKYLAELGITGAQLAAMCNVDRHIMRRWFQSDDCKMSEMEKMAKAAGYKFEWRWVKEDE